jgi:hypothetical protein
VQLLDHLLPTAVATEVNVVLHEESVEEVVAVTECLVQPVLGVVGHPHMTPYIAKKLSQGFPVRLIEGG